MRLVLLAATLAWGTGRTYKRATPKHLLHKMIAKADRRACLVSTTEARSEQSTGLNFDFFTNRSHGLVS